MLANYSYRCYNNYKKLLYNGISVDEVRRDIQYAIDEGWNNPDPQVQKYWHNISSKHKKPTMDEVIEYIVKKAR